jgi:hypothetical protein
VREKLSAIVSCLKALQYLILTGEERKSTTESSEGRGGGALCAGKGLACPAPSTTLLTLAQTLVPHPMATSYPGSTTASRSMHP